MNLTSKRRSLKRIYEPFGNIFVKAHLSPNVITVVSIVMGLLAAYSYYKEKPLTAAFFLALSGFFDLMDGIVARETDRSSKFGAVFDWLADKLVDGFVLFFIGITYSTPVLTALAVVVNMLHTFIKPVAYAEIGFSSREKGKIDDPLEGVGFFGRPETIIAILFFSVLEHFKILGGLETGFIVITALMTLSLLQRVIYLYRRYNKDYD
ncbi:MAG: CDP-alcohol phosphatidyltransferase family protein [Aquificae bacterium]|nr:CDP-alcohol phosphatidyltransferase family protein [Aquificota bacterium]